MKAIDRVKIARDPKRPHLKDFISLICSDFEELKGDRLVSDDRGLIGGFAVIEEGAGERCRCTKECSDLDCNSNTQTLKNSNTSTVQPSTSNTRTLKNSNTSTVQPSTFNLQPLQFRVLILGHNKGATVEENMAANFGMANPDGYRKAMRLAKLAEKFHLPVVTFVDTPGAYPGREAEERGQAEAIAKSLEFFSTLKTPVVVVVTGEGGSGGALAIAVGDRILMMENAVYSVISPEGCAGILWRDGKKAPEAAEALKITAADLKRLGAIDEIVKEPAGGAQKNHALAAANVKKAILKALKELSGIPADELVAQRYAKLRAYGNFH